MTTKDSSKLENAIAAAATAASNAASVQKDIEYIKKDIGEIKNAVKEMTMSFVTQAAFQDTANTATDHEKRLRLIEENMWKWVGIGTIVSVVVTTVIATIIKNYLG